MTRYYRNNFVSAQPKEVIFNQATKKLSNEISDEISDNTNRLLKILQQNTSHDAHDYSIYTGHAGLAYLYYKLTINNKSHFENFSKWTELSLKSLKGRDMTFLCGDIGPLCMGTALRVLEDRSSDEFVLSISNFSKKVLKEDSSVPNELLYGRVGYLYGLLFLKSVLPNLNTPLPIQQVVRAVIKAGLTGKQPPLMWNWHGKEYLGAAHGVAGILYLLLEAKDVLQSDELLLIKQTVDYLISIRFKSGNLPSSIGSSDDRLVHWCHGAPGFVQVLLKAHEVWGDDVYLEAAEQCGEVVWQRGLLKKGYGICHGVAGNAYTFIALFQATHNERHLYRAIQYARWCSTYDRNQEHPPDRPFSLFEGLAGTIYFLNDIQNPLEALYPAFSISPFKKTS